MVRDQGERMKGAQSVDSCANLNWQASEGSHGRKYISSVMCVQSVMEISASL